MMENIEELEVEMVKDEKGRVVWPFNFLSGADFSLNNIHIPSLKPGAVHGNHYHKYSTEYIFIMSGPCRACFQDNITGEKADFLIPRWPLENPPPVAGSKSPTLRQQNGCKLIQFLF